MKEITAEMTDLEFAQAVDVELAEILRNSDQDFEYIEGVFKLCKEVDNIFQSRGKEKLFENITVDSTGNRHLTLLSDWLESLLGENIYEYLF